MMKEFYLVADWGAHNYLTVPNIMLSAGSIAQTDGKKWNMSRVRLPEGYPDKLILDSGGYSFFSRWGDYPFSISSYVDLANILKDMYPLERVATLDYPCEPKINRINDLQTNEERIRATVNMAGGCIDEDKTLPWLPVIQGYTINEYLYCLDLYADIGITSDYWAIGSICSRKGNLLELRNLIVTIRDQFDNEKLHAFGLGIPFLKDPQIFQAIYSSDSSAWNWGISGPNTRDRKKEAALKYLALIEDMMCGAENQTQLGDLIK